MGRNMTACRLVATLRAKGIKLQAKGNRLLYCPRSAVTPELLSELVKKKAEILASIANSAPVRLIPPLDERDPDFALTDHETCFHCGGTGVCARSCCQALLLANLEKALTCRACLGKGTSKLPKVLQ